jgi:hypothetical protein
VNAPHALGFFLCSNLSIYVLKLVSPSQLLRFFLCPKLPVCTLQEVSAPCSLGFFSCYSLPPPFAFQQVSTPHLLSFIMCSNLHPSIPQSVSAPAHMYSFHVVTCYILCSSVCECLLQTQIPSMSSFVPPSMLALQSVSSPC